jgi:hypothetical protein
MAGDIETQRPPGHVGARLRVVRPSAADGRQPRRAGPLLLAWRQLREFRTARGRLPWLPALILVVVPTALLYLSNKRTGGGGDTRPAMLAAISLATEGNSDLDEFCRDGRIGRTLAATGQLPYFVQRQGPHILSKYPAGMVAFALPVAAAARLAGARLDDPVMPLRLEKVAAAVVGALGAGLFFLIALHLAPPAVALTATALFAIASAQFSTVGQGLWQQGGVIFWSVVVLLVEFRGEGRPARSRLSTLLQGMACGMMPACRLTAAVFLVPFGLWVFARAPRRAVAIATLAALAYLPWGLAYWALYGTPLGPSTSLMHGSLWTSPIGWQLLGVLVSPGRGLLVYQPWVLLAPLAFVPTIRRAAARLGCDAGPPGWEAFCATVILFQIAVISAWSIWWGGWCWGSRLVAEVLPLCALLALRPIALLGRSRPGRAMVLALGLVGLLMHVPSVYLNGPVWNNAADVDFHTEALWSWSRAPFLFPITGKGPS